MTDWPPPNAGPPEPSTAQVELLRRRSIQVLASAADALQAAADKQASLGAEIQAAELRLERAHGQRIAILSDIEQAVTDSSKRRADLLDEVAMLERRRDALAEVVSEPRVVFTDGVAKPRVAVALVSEVAVDEVRAELFPEVIASGVDSDQWKELEKQLETQFATPAAVAVTRSGSAVRKMAAGARTFAPRRVISRLATGSLLVMLLGLAVLLTPLTQVFGGLELLAVMSGSMEPTIHVGGVVAIRPVPPAELKVGDAITFVNQSSPDVLVTHRVVSMEVRDGQTMLTTKGDANDTVDALSAPASRAVGRVEFSLPYLGYLMIYLSSPMAKVAILAVAVVGLGLASHQPSSPPPPPPPAVPTSIPEVDASYAKHEREIQALLD